MAHISVKLTRWDIEQIMRNKGIQIYPYNPLPISAVTVGKETDHVVLYFDVPDKESE